MLQSSRQSADSVIIETPRGCRNKYRCESGRLKHLEDAGKNDFPYHFGCIAGALAGDGDPLDGLVLSDELKFPGCEVDYMDYNNRRRGGGQEQRMKGQKKYQNDRLMAASAPCLLASRFESARVTGMSFLRCA